MKRIVILLIAAFMILAPTVSGLVIYLTKNLDAGQISLLIMLAFAGIVSGVSLIIGLNSKPDNPQLN